MGRKNKLTIEFSGYERLKKQLDEIGGNATERAVESSLEASQQLVAKQAAAAMTPHKETGRTQSSIVKNNPVVWIGDTAAIDVGFDIADGGLASIFLMYGTTLHGQPHVTPDKKLYDSVYGSKTRKQVKKIQEQTFQKVIRGAAKK